MTPSLCCSKYDVDRDEDPPLEQLLEQTVLTPHLGAVSTFQHLCQELLEQPFQHRPQELLEHPPRVVRTASFVRPLERSSINSLDAPAAHSGTSARRVRVCEREGRDELDPPPRSSFWNRMDLWTPPRNQRRALLPHLPQEWTFGAEFRQSRAKAQVAKHAPGRKERNTRPGDPPQAAGSGPAKHAGQVCTTCGGRGRPPRRGRREVQPRRPRCRGRWRSGRHGAERARRRGPRRAPRGRASCARARAGSRAGSRARACASTGPGSGGGGLTV